MARPQKYTEYRGLPDREYLAKAMMGMYNYCFDYRQVAVEVNTLYRNDSRHLRAEMITTSLIGHRRGRMLNGFDGFDIDEYVRDLLQEMNENGIIPQGRSRIINKDW